MRINSQKKQGRVQTLLFIKSKIQFFESKSQLKIPNTLNNYCCLSSQRYNFLKANHNSMDRHQSWEEKI